MSALLAALKQLDPQNDNHWTDDGMPRVEMVRFLAKDNKVTREDIVKAAPEFSRTVPVSDEPVGDDVGGASNVETQQSGGHGGSSDEEGQALQGLEQQLAAAQEELVASAQRKAEADKEHQAKQSQVDRLLEEIEQARPGAAPLGQDIRAYLNSQQRVLAARAEQTQRLQSIGGMAAIKAIMPSRAPIDQALKGRKR